MRRSNMPDETARELASLREEVAGLRRAVQDLTANVQMSPPITYIPYVPAAPPIVLPYPQIPPPSPWQWPYDVTITCNADVYHTTGCASYLLNGSN